MNYVNHLTNMKEMFCRFVEASWSTKYDSLFDQMLVEQFLASSPAPVRAFVLNKEPKNSVECAKYADLSYEVWKQNKEATNDGKPFSANGSYHGTLFSSLTNGTGPGRPSGGFNQKTGNYGGRPAQHLRVGGQMNFRPPAGPYRPNGPNYSSYNNPPRMQVRNTLAPFDKRNASYFVHDDMVSDVDCVHNDDVLMHDTACEHADNLYANDDEFADCEFIIPLMLEDQETNGIRDTGNLGPVLVSKDFISPERIIPGKYCVAGSF